MSSSISPESVVSALRKQQAYLASILSKNEVSRHGPYNRKLFLRMRHGQYLSNPQLALLIEGDWRRISELLSLERVAGELPSPVVLAGRLFDINKGRQAAIDDLRTLIQDLNADGGLPPELF